MSENENYATCIAQFLESGEVDTVSAFECFAAESRVEADATEKKTKVLFFVYCSSLVFLMQAGFAMICSGCVRKKNVQNTILKNFLDVCGSSIAFFFVGYAFAFGGGEEGKTTFIGNTNFLLTQMDFNGYGIDYAHWTFHFAFAATAGKFYFYCSWGYSFDLDANLTFPFYSMPPENSATIVAGTLAERCQMNAYLFYSMVLTGFGKSHQVDIFKKIPTSDYNLFTLYFFLILNLVYPVIVHNVWSSNGYLSASNANPLVRFMSRFKFGLLDIHCD